MSKKDKIVKVAWRKWVILGSFLLLFIGCVIATYIIQYNTTKVVPFSSDSLTKISSTSQITDFEFDVYCKEYNTPASGNKKTMKFSASIDKAIENYEFSSIKYTVAMGDEHWTKNYVSSSATTISSSKFTSTSNAITDKTCTISDFQYTYPVRKLLFIKIDKPTVYVKLTYDKKKVATQKTESISYLLEYSYDEYFRSGVTILG
ncbi:MAG: hypothetical protein ACI35W_00995 [Anaeroplasmataceae bacterium]